ncbi:hypothetical protein ABB37_01760 [Leptomonas pyrrhocoris]|uniref:Uncharacterized protein n=1 Tax=Leptomonas pyrrhocoris TaxID=157538 RepID=A0A0M9G9G5_LEPPY|nr:hypothetical protein ABB37_01760 [Leptomonas pyrrhocoris]KPA85467.1 hypothetical protein ABB37_01760 [Leptomonas pyrrhocoris]|eukprot:XP_015663906.1 hypothetical protein ABB37_01760 [Leptomonas pyrrhocoris]
MDVFPQQEEFLQEGRTVPLWKKQGEFVRFLVNTYYVEPNKLIEEEKGVSHRNELSGLPFHDFPFGDDVAKVLGRIAEEAVILDQKHVQEKLPFCILEKPLAVPAMIGVLLQCFFFEEYGVFISSTTFDIWASKALGFEIHLSRVWLDAECHVHRALLCSSAKRLVNQRSARETGIHAMNLQSRSGGPLHRMWNYTYGLLCAELSVTPLQREDSDELFLQAMKGSIILRQNLEAALRSQNFDKASPTGILYSTAEPELCACATYHVCFRTFESVFNKQTNTREKRLCSANVMQYFFHGCLNAFTFNRYDQKKIPSSFETLDSVAVLADGKRMTTRRNLKATGMSALPTYLQRVQLLSYDHISGEVVSSTNCNTFKPSINDSNKFSEMDSTAIDVNAMYSFCSNEHTEEGKKPDSDDTALKQSSPQEARSDRENYSRFTTFFLERTDDDCAKYILSEEERNAKKLIYSQLYGHKRRRVP